MPVTPSAIDETIKPKGFTDANTSAFAIIGALKSAAETALIFKSFFIFLFPYLLVIILKGKKTTPFYINCNDFIENLRGKFFIFKVNRFHSIKKCTLMVNVHFQEEIKIFSLVIYLLHEKQQKNQRLP